MILVNCLGALGYRSTMSRHYTTNSEEWHSQDSCNCPFQERLPFSRRKFIWGNISEHHWSNIRHRIRFEQNPQVRNRNLATIILWLLKRFQDTFNFQKIVLWSFLEKKLRRSYPFKLIVKQWTIDLFTAAAEYVALSYAVQEIFYLRLSLEDLGYLQL
jgi:hypothetical protein